METKKTPIRFWMLAVVIIAVAGFFGVSRASAATLSFSPSAATYLSGRSFTVFVKVSSPDQAMNAAQGEISFPANELTVLSVSKTNSVLNLWVQDPTFSNHDGTVDFSGVAVNPGFQGSNGTVIAITFEAKNSGDAPLSFSSASVLANDGKGTNILTDTSGASLTITPLTVAPPSAGGSTPVVAPSITITSNPQVKNGTWYNINQITFDWSVPSNAEGVDYTISTNPNLQLSDVDQGLISQTSYDLSNLSDGPWYFFVSFESGNTWSPPIKKAIMLDRTPPDSFVVSRTDTNEADAQPVFAWAAADQGSGIDHYQIKIGDGDWFDPSGLQNGSSSYVLPVQSPTAARTLTVRAFDKAGNSRDASVTFRVLSPGVPCGGNTFSCGLSAFFSQWGWLVTSIFAILLLVALGLIYHLLRWKKSSWKEVKKFEKELRSDLTRIEKEIADDRGGRADLSKPHLLAQKKSFEKEVDHIVDDVKEEIQKLEE